MIQQQYPNIKQNNLKQDQYEQNSQLSIQMLSQLPTDLLVQILFVSDVGEVDISKCVIFNNNQQVQLVNTINQIIVYMHRNIRNNIEQTLSQVTKYLNKQQNNQNKTKQLYWIIDYLIKYINHQYSSNLSKKIYNFVYFKQFFIHVSNIQNQNWWYQFIKCIVLSVIQHQSQNNSIQYTTQFIQYFKNNLQKQLITQYLVQPNQTLLVILKKILQLVSSTKPQYVQTLRKNFIQLYINHKQQTLPKIKNNSYQQKQRIRTFNILKLIQLLHIADNKFTISDLATSYKFIHGQLYTCMCDFETKGANALAINIYGAIIKQLQLFDHNMQAFVDIYLTLDCYGMHLIKDIWHRFYLLCRNANQYKSMSILQGKYHLYPICTLLHIILCKVQQHSNNNVPKYCIQSVLGASPQDTMPIFEYLQDTVYGSLVQILNTGTHYNDCTHFHQDSKIYDLTRKFYLGYYNIIAKQSDAQAKLKEHLRKLLNAMIKYITFQHCIIGYIGIFAHIPTRQGKCMKLFGKQQVQILVSLAIKFIIKLTFRKRHKLIQSTLMCIQQNVDFQHISIGWMMNNVVMCLSQQILQIKVNRKYTSIPKIYQIIKNNYTSVDIQLRIKQLSQQSAIVQHGLIQVSDIYQQNYKVQVTKYLQLYKQLAILSTILNWENNQTENPILNKIFTQTLPLLCESSYAHPLQHAAAILYINNSAIYNRKDIISQIISKGDGGKWANNLLMIISSNQNNKIMDMDSILRCLQLVAMTIVQSNSQPICKSYAKFIQYCINRLGQPQQCKQYYTQLLINALKYKNTYTIKYKAIQDCLYSLFQSHLKLLPYINPKNRLRIQLLVLSILCHDQKYTINLLNNKNCPYINELQEYSNLYDYQHLQQFFNFCVRVAEVLVKAHANNKINIQTYQVFKQNILHVLKQTVKNMLHSLDYGVHKKDVVASSQSVVKIAIMLQLNQQAVNMIKYMLQVGQNYWGFHRHTILTVLKQMQNIQDINRLGVGLRRLLSIFICVQQYRGQDSAILLHQHNNLPIYTHNKLHEQSDYDGTALRFIVIEWIYTKLNTIQSIQNQSNRKNTICFWLQLFQQVLGVCLADNSKQRMFLTGSHKPKLKNCQILMIFDKFIHKYTTPHQYKQIVLRILNSMSQNNLNQVKHYLQTFMMKLLYINPSQQLLSKVCQKLTHQLLEIQGQNSLLKNVSFMVIAGLVLQLHYHDGLFAVVFASVCSHIAYFRGISQYFCYKFINRVKQMHFKDIKYVIILYQQYLKDQDAIKLTEKLQKIIQDYKKLVINWNMYDNLLKQKPTINNQVIPNDHYIDKLKYIGHQLIKQHKHEDGYMPYKQAWKKIIQQYNNIKSIQNIGFNQNQSGSFQRKIDPSLDDIYNFQPNISFKRFKSNLKVMVISAQHIAFYGHMARIGQILGIQQLSIPNLNIIDMDDFSNVSVTAQKWLNITQHKYQRLRIQKQGQKQQKIKKQQRVKKKKQQKKIQKKQQTDQYQQKNKQQLIKALKQHKAQNYKLFMVNKNPNNLILQPSSLMMDKKSILVIDQLGYLGQDVQINNMMDRQISFNNYYSYHVQATIFIWQYFKKFNLNTN